MRPNEGTPMGGKLARRVLETLPRDITSAERLLLSSIAILIRDESAEGMPGREALQDMTGMDARTMAKVFARLAERDLDPRVPLGVDASGRPFFAARGRRTTYRFPGSWTTPTTTTQSKKGCPGKGALARAPFLERVPSDAERVPSENALSQDPEEERVPPRAPLKVQELTPPLVTPVTNVKPLDQDQTTAAPARIETTSRYVEPPEAAAVEKLIEPYRTIARSLLDHHPTQGELEHLHRWVLETRTPRNVLSYIRGMAANNAFLPQLLIHRSEALTAAAGQAAERLRQARLTGPLCPHGEADILNGSGEPQCPGCRRGTVRTLIRERMPVRVAKTAKILHGIDRTGTMTKEQLMHYASAVQVLIDAGIEEL